MNSSEQRHTAILVAQLEEHDPAVDQRGAGEDTIMQHLNQVIEANEFQCDIFTTEKGIAVVFSSVIDAVRCAIRLQQILTKSDEIAVRIGIHQGEAEKNEDGISGIDLDIARFIASSASWRSILISGQVYAQIEHHPDIETLKIGNIKIADSERGLDIYTIINEGLVIPKVPGVDSGKLLSPTAIFWKRLKNRWSS